MNTPMKHITDIYARTVDYCGQYGFNPSDIRIMYDAFIFKTPNDSAPYSVEEHGDLRPLIHVAHSHTQDSKEMFRWNSYFSYIQIDRDNLQQVHIGRVHYHDWKEISYGFMRCSVCAMAALPQHMTASCFGIVATCVRIIG